LDVGRDFHAGEKGPGCGKSALVIVARTFNYWALPRHHPAAFVGEGRGALSGIIAGQENLVLLIALTPIVFI
jgi:hypothetical protein